MELPLQVTYRNMAKPDSLDAQIRHRVEELDRFFGRIVSCRVMVEARHRHQAQGTLYHVRIDLVMPGAEIVVSRDPAEHHAHEDAHVAVRDAFDAARRQLEDRVRRQGDGPDHRAEMDRGKVASLIADEGYGFIVTSEGEEIYFDGRSVPNGGFARLSVGDEVRYALHPGEGEKGPQASTVIPAGGHRPR